MSLLERCRQPSKRHRFLAPVSLPLASVVNTMASYVIAGPAGDEALSECEYLGRQLELSCNASVSIVVKHPDEWAAYLATVPAT